MTPNTDTCSEGGNNNDHNVIEDIEDVFKMEEDNNNRQSNAISTVKIHTRGRRKTVKKGEGEEEDPPPPQDEVDKEDEGEENLVESNDIKPEVHKIFMRTWGCSHNTSDSEYMAGLLVQSGYSITNDKSLASVWILNSCTVKGPSEQHFKNEVNEGLNLKKKVVVSGCVPQSDPRGEYIKGLSIIGVKQIDEIVTVVEETLKGNTVRLLSFQKKKGANNGNNNGVLKNPPGASLHFPKIRKNEFIEIIPISTGCLNSCTYCKTKLARGNLSSYPIDEIVSRAQHVIKNEGVKEIWLTSEDLGAWGIDLGMTIVDLLQALVECIPKDCMLRLGMTNPPYILDHLAEIAEILNHPQVYGFLHIPIQSGSDSVLLEMKREYTRKQFEHIVTFLQSRVPSLTIATDLICGFPTETDEDFEETFQLVDKYRFPVLYINQFYPRPGTPAAKMRRIPTHFVKERTKRMTLLFRSYTPYQPFRLGMVYKDVLFTETSHDSLHVVGHNKAYEQILVRMDRYPEKGKEIMGKKIDVRITGVTKFCMIAEPIDREEGKGRVKSSFFYLFTLILLAFLCLLLSLFWVEK